LKKPLVVCNPATRRWTDGGRAKTQPSTFNAGCSGTGGCCAAGRSHRPRYGAVGP
jgi:hypothetical protein